MLTFSADLFRIAYLCASTKETRYYLRGVFVRPTFTGEPGALLVATDGHSLVCLYDPDAVNVPKDGVILTLDNVKPGALFKTGKRDGKPRLVKWTDCAAMIWTQDADGVPGAMQGAARMTAIDGSFPDFSRVVPSMKTPTDDTGKPETFPANPFNAALVSRMAEIGSELGKLRGESDAVAIIEERGIGNPALVRYPKSQAFGVLMPMRHGHADDCDSSWYRK